MVPISAPLTGFAILGKIPHLFRSLFLTWKIKQFTWVIFMGPSSLIESIHSQVFGHMRKNSKDHMSHFPLVYYYKTCTYENLKCIQNRWVKHHGPKITPYTYSTLAFHSAFSCISHTLKAHSYILATETESNLNFPCNSGDIKIAIEFQCSVSISAMVHATRFIIFYVIFTPWFYFGKIYKTNYITQLNVLQVRYIILNHSSKASILWCSAFFIVQLSHPYVTGKTIALTRWTFVGKVMSLLFNMLCRFVIAFLPRSKHLLISWLQ